MQKEAVSEYVIGPGVGQCRLDVAKRRPERIAWHADNGGSTSRGHAHHDDDPAGAIGNDLPIKIVSERWYSPELKTVVMSKHSDPRMGDTVYS